MREIVPLDMQSVIEDLRAMRPNSWYRIGGSRVKSRPNLLSDNITITTLDDNGVKTRQYKRAAAAARVIMRLWEDDLL